MEYRRLGQSGLKVSALSFGSWITFGPQVSGDLAAECLTAAFDAGVNFFDNAEAYASGESERIMGQTIAKLGWPRYSFIVSTKLFWGLHRDTVNMVRTLNRKYLMQAMDGSLERLGLDFVDLVYCHRPDPQTSIEEIAWTMHDLVDRGQALYWGTSEFSAHEIRQLFEVAERYGLRKPIVEQPQYHLLERDRVEKEYASLYADFGIGLTTWSPLASGVLTGKYLDGVPKGSRAEITELPFVRDQLVNPEINAKVAALMPIADALGCSLAQLAIAWCTVNPHVSTVITGASRVEQVHENLAALEVATRLTPDVLKQIDQAIGA